MDVLMIIVVVIVIMFDIINHLFLEKRSYIVRNNGSLTKGQENSLCSLKNERLMSKENRNQQGIYINQLNECSDMVRRKFNSFFANKNYFPFNKGIQRLLFVFWIAISGYVEISHWILRGQGIENYGWGFVSLIVLPCLYVIVVWIYNGFKEE